MNRGKFAKMPTNVFSKMWAKTNIELHRVLALFLLILLPVEQAIADELPIWADNFSEGNPLEIQLGQLLFYDPILSGSKTVACATCHHPRFGTSDGLSLGLGDGATRLGPERRADPENYPELRVARNSPALFNLGAPEFIRLFHDGRLEKDLSHPSGIRSPLDETMVMGFDSILSAQAMFPVLSPDEMAGHYSENDVSRAVRMGLLSNLGGAWDTIANRVEVIKEYRTLFDQVNPPIQSLQFTDISNAIAAFISFEWRADNSPFDQHLRGEKELGETALTGAKLFYGKAGCSTCHSGLYQTDHDFHAIAMPQIGPGKTERFENHNRDIGRMRVTGNPADAYRFRTPSLRNITATAPYGHAGTYGRLEDVILHHLDPVAALYAYSPDNVILPAMDATDDFTIQKNPDDLAAIATANELLPQQLSETEIDELIAFLRSLTDKQSMTGRLGIPPQVPSGLPVDQ